MAPLWFELSAGRKSEAPYNDVLFNADICSVNSRIKKRPLGAGALKNKRLRGSH